MQQQRPNADKNKNKLIKKTNQTKNFGIIIYNNYSESIWGGIFKLLDVNFKMQVLGFPGGAVVGSLPANAGDAGSSPRLEDPTCRGATGPVSHNC